MSNAEISALRVGSIVRTPRGYRVVRAVKHWPPARNAYQPRCCVTFTIQRRSWTGRCYTVLNRSDLRSRRYQPMTARIRLQDTLSHRIARDITTGSKSVSVDEVRGIA